jgi:hypothetical protein
MNLSKQVTARRGLELHISPNTDSASRFSTLKTVPCLGAVKLLNDQGRTPSVSAGKEVTMVSDSPKKRLERTWDELVAEATAETDPEKFATMLEEIFAALEERERTLSLRQNPAG